MRIAHLSDLHFSKITYSPSQFFSKRWLGNLNLTLSRQRTFKTDHLFDLISLFKEHLIDHLIITGDLTTTSLESEFEQAAEFIQAFQKEGVTTHILPGNHDHYTQNAYKKQLFYRYFPSELSHKKVAKTCLGAGWWLVSLDTALATSLFSSRGEFSVTIEQELETTLLSIPPNEKIILANHFPIFNNDRHRKVLVRAEALANQLKRFPQVLLYLHGHTHRHCIADLRPNQLPIILESGSPSYLKHSSCHVLDIQNKGLDIHVFQHQNEKWNLAKKQHLRLV